MGMQMPPDEPSADARLQAAATLAAAIVQAGEPVRRRGPRPFLAVNPVDGDEAAATLWAERDVMRAAQAMRMSISRIQERTRQIGPT